MGIKLGLGLYPRILTSENLRFARQMGASHIVAHLPDWSRSGMRKGVSPEDRNPPLWTYEELRDLRAFVNAEGLELAAIENFEPVHWHDVLLDGPKKAEQVEGLKQIIRNMGRAGIPVMGYNFSIAIGYQEAEAPEHSPIPLGTVWNTVYDPDAPHGDIGTIGAEEFWSRAEYFLTEVVPVAEAAGVRLAAHPDDPPLPVVRGTARLVYRPELYQRLLDIYPSRSNALEFCQGTVAEMVSDEMDVYDAIDRYASQGAIAYVHFRNVRGKVPSYEEVFLDEGDVDMFRALRLYVKHGYDGVMIPDHTPSVESAAPWHTGMAWALGYMRAAIQLIEGGRA